MRENGKVVARWNALAFQTSIEGLTTDLSFTKPPDALRDAVIGRMQRLGYPGVSPSAFDYLAWVSSEAHRVLRTTCECTGMEWRVAFW
jgi:hypothetical protein